MLKTYFVDRVFNGNDFLDNQRISVLDGKITRIVDAVLDPSDHHISGLLAPGFIDVQVNGGGGALFNNDSHKDGLSTMVSAHQRFGSTSMLPTLITDGLATMTRAANAMSDAMASQIKGIAGIHFEGPHLSQPKKGIHPQQHIRPITDQEIALFMRKDLGQVLVTLAPENISCDVIRDLVNNDVIVCLGHSNASAKQVEDALQAGATGFTHLFNAMSPLSSREPGMVGMALLDESSFCGLIVDHFHVDKQVCKLAIKCKGPQHIMLVTDAMSHVGSTQKSVTFAGMEISREGNKLTIEGGRLAGSSLDMASAVRNTHIDLNLSLADSLKMASRTPAKFLGIDSFKGKIANHYNADWVVLDDQLQVIQTWIDGEQVYASNNRVTP